MKIVGAVMLRVLDGVWHHILNCCSGDALITFNYERHAVNCIDDHAPGRLQQLWRFIPCAQQGRKKAPRLKGSVITVVR